MFKKISSTVILFVLAFGLVGCSTDVRITEGNVSNKSYHEAYTESVLECVSLGSDGFCAQYLQKERQIPESWTVQITDDVDGEAKFAVFYVSESTYEKTEVGDYMNFND